MAIAQVETAARPRPVGAADLREAERFCVAILPSVSRTFALSIRVLPGTLGRAVLAAYLLCRIADTIEDEPELDGAAKARLFDELRECLDDPTRAAALARRCEALRGDPAHVRLASHADRVFRVYDSLPERSREPVRRWVTEMVQGMRKFVVLYPSGIRIQTLQEYREYCYYVAGTVGYLLTDLWRAHAGSIGISRYRRLHARARAFGEALQTVNILKDVARDAEQENSMYIPEEALRAHGSSHATILAPHHRAGTQAALGGLAERAQADLEDALEYLVLLPRRAVAIRLFCALPLVFARATLRELTRSTSMLTPGGTVKISRREVKSLLLAVPLLIFSNRALRRLVARVGIRPYELRGLGSGARRTVAAAGSTGGP